MNYEEKCGEYYDMNSPSLLMTPLILGMLLLEFFLEMNWLIKILIMTLKGLALAQTQNTSSKEKEKCFTKFGLVLTPPTNKCLKHFMGT